MIKIFMGGGGGGRGGGWGGGRDLSKEHFKTGCG